MMDQVQTQYNTYERDDERDDDERSLKPMPRSYDEDSDDAYVPIGPIIKKYYQEQYQDLYHVSPKHMYGEKSCFNSMDDEDYDYDYEYMSEYDDIESVGNGNSDCPSDGNGDSTSESTNDGTSDGKKKCSQAGSNVKMINDIVDGQVYKKFSYI